MRDLRQFRPYNLGMELRISRALIAAIRTELAVAGGDECCGLLLGDRTAATIRAIRPAANIAQAPRHRFEIDPAVLIAAHKAARAGGPAILGHYHSHPAGAPVPSACDAAMALENGVYWLILGDGGEVRAWRAEDGGALHGRFAPIALMVADDPPTV